MARGELIGHMPTCHVCGLEGPGPEVRLDKNAKPYAYCPDCSTQTLTHGGRRGELMVQRMTPVKRVEWQDGRLVIVGDIEPEPEPAPEPAAKPTGRTLMG